MLERTHATNPDPLLSFQRIMSSTNAAQDVICPATGMSKASRGELSEFSVVYTDRAVNLMSSPFQEVMRDISASLKKVYNAQGCCVIPGSGTYGMEAVARTFGTKKKCLVVRNGFFSFRWSDIFAVCEIPSEEIVMMARAVDEDATPSFAPCPIDEVVAKIKAERPDAVFAPHVETATGMVLTDEYIQGMFA
jgi:aspartate aminotransferase-like enzyme